MSVCESIGQAEGIPLIIMEPRKQSKVKLDCFALWL
jgi:hypothetical protein